MYEFDYIPNAQLRDAERKAVHSRVYRFAKKHRDYVNRVPLHPAPAQWKRVCKWVKVRPGIDESNPFMRVKYRNYRVAHSKKIMQWRK